MFDFRTYYDMIAQQLPNGCRVCEVGLANGKSFIYLAEALLNQGKTWERMIGIDNCDYGSKNQANEITNNLLRAGIPNIEFWDSSSLDASCKFPDGYLDFVFLDSSHAYSQTKAEVRLWIKKMKGGGILAGHDYVSVENPDVKQAIDEVVPANFLKTYPTDNSLGVWEVRQTDNLTIQ